MRLLCLVVEVVMRRLGARNWDQSEGPRQIYRGHGLNIICVALRVRSALHSRVDNINLNI